MNNAKAEMGKIEDKGPAERLNYFTVDVDAMDVPEKARWLTQDAGGRVDAWANAPSQVDDAWEGYKLLSTCGICLGGENKNWRHTILDLQAYRKSLQQPAETEWHPKVGKAARVASDTGRDLEYGQDVLGQQVEVKAIFMSGDVEVAAVEHDGVCYCFRTSMLRPAKSEREVTKDKMVQVMEESAGHAAGLIMSHVIAGALYDAGYRKQ